MWSHPQVNEELKNDNSANSPQGYFYQLHKLVSPDPSPYVGHRDVFSTSNEERNRGWGKEEPGITEIIWFAFLLIREKLWLMHVI